jgi:hypothetical protein
MIPPTYSGSGYLQRTRLPEPKTSTLNPQSFFEGPQSYAHESVTEEVAKLLSFPEEYEPDHMAIEDLLTARQHRQQQNTDAPALFESQVGGEEMEQDQGS